MQTVSGTRGVGIVGGGNGGESFTGLNLEYFRLLLFNEFVHGMNEFVG